MRTLYVARHGEASADGVLTPAGRRQAALLGVRLAAVPLTGVFHSPVARAAQTASIVAESLGAVPVTETELLDDYPPTDEPVPGYSALARAAGPALGARALAEFGTLDDRHDLLITHSQLVGWFARAALDAPVGRWVGLNAANTALTVIQFRQDRVSLLTFNDQCHLPPELRWTGFPMSF